MQIGRHLNYYPRSPASVTNQMFAVQYSSARFTLRLEQTQLKDNALKMLL
jgi:hypothetical protein